MTRYHPATSHPPCNRGATRIRLRPRNTDPMQIYDTAPAILREWLAEAKRPWSPASCLALFQSALARGETPQQALRRLSMVENSMLARDACFVFHSAPKPCMRASI